MRHFRKSILIPVVACMLMAACSDDDGLTDTAPATASQQTGVTMQLTRAAVDSFAEAGINDVRVFAYIRQNKRDSLVKDTTINIGDGRFQIGLPLGENIRTFIVANAEGIDKTEKIDSVTLTLDPTRDADIWLSNVISLTTDKTVRSIQFNMRRIIGRATFQPEEDTQTIAALGKFDNTDVTFTNIATQYRINGDSAIALTSASFNSYAANNYSATVNSFITREGIDPTAGLELTFKNGQAVVNGTPAAIDGGFNYTGATNYVMVVPITDEAFLQNPWTRAMRTLCLPFSLSSFKF